MKEEWPQFDWSTVDPVFPAKTGRYANTIPTLTKRGIEVRKWLRERPEKVIAVVSHSGFLTPTSTVLSLLKLEANAVDFSN